MRESGSELVYLRRSSNDCEEVGVGAWRDKMTRTTVLLVSRWSPRVLEDENSGDQEGLWRHVSPGNTCWFTWVRERRQEGVFFHASPYFPHPLHPRELHSLLSPLSFSTPLSLHPTWKVQASLFASIAWMLLFGSVASQILNFLLRNLSHVPLSISLLFYFYYYYFKTTLFCLTLILNDVKFHMAVLVHKIQRNIVILQFKNRQWCFQTSLFNKTSL